MFSSSKSGRMDDFYIPDILFRNNAAIKCTGLESEEEKVMHSPCHKGCIKFDVQNSKSNISSETYETYT